VVVGDADRVAFLANVLQGTLDACLGLALTASCVITGAYLRLKAVGTSEKKSK
jgi:hypothetical protein